MIRFTIDDIATPGANIDDADVWATVEVVNKGDLKDRLTRIGYSDFLSTPYWRATSRRVKQRDRMKCRLCPRTDRLEVHHPDYSHRGEDHLFMDELITLCNGCHSKFHGKPAKPVSTPYRRSPTAKQLRRMRSKERAEKKRLERVRRKAQRVANSKARWQSVEQHNAEMKTYAACNSLAMEDLLTHASIHKQFNYRKLAAWLDAEPGRWDAYRCVSDANRAMKGKP